MAGFTTEWTVTSGDLTITLPLTNNGTYNATVDWGDSGPTGSITAYDDADRSHTYSGAGTYNVEKTGSCPGWSFNNSTEGAKCTNIIDWGASADFDGFQYLNNGFKGAAIVSTGTGSIQLDGTTFIPELFASCSSLTTLNAALFDNFGSVTYLAKCFQGCSSLSGTLPTGLLDGLTSNQRFDFFFSGTGAIVLPSGIMDTCVAAQNLTYFLYNSEVVGLPDGLLDNCTAVTNCTSFCFDTPIETVPSGLFAKLTLCTNFTDALRRNASLQLRSDIFYDAADRDTRFLNKSINFTRCFELNAGTFVGTKGIAPDLWKCDFGTGTPTTTSCFSNHSLSSVDNYNGIPSAWGGPATISDPTISSMTDTSLTDGQTSVLITGNIFCYDILDIELGNASTYAACTVLESQTFDNSNTTETSAIIGTVVQGVLSDGNAWVYVTHYRGQTNASGYAVTISSGTPTNAASFSGDISGLTSLVLASQKNYAEFSCDISGLGSSATASNTSSNLASFTGNIPGITSIATASQKNKSVFSGDIAGLSSLSTAEQKNGASFIGNVGGLSSLSSATNTGINAAIFTGLIGGIEFSSTVSQTNDSVFSGSIPGLSSSATASNLGVNRASFGGTVSGVISVATADQKNSVSFAGDIAGLISESTASNSVTNPASFGGSISGLSSSSNASQRNGSLFTGSIGGLASLASATHKNSALFSGGLAGMQSYAIARNSGTIPRCPDPIKLYNDDLVLELFNDDRKLKVYGP